MSETVKILCDVEGFGEFWVEYDVSTWGIKQFVDIPVQTAFGALHNYLAKYCVGWNIESDDGDSVPCPIQGAPWEAWTQSFEQIGPKTGKAIYTWLCMSVLSALTLASSPSPKSDEGG